MSPADPHAHLDEALRHGTDLAPRSGVEAMSTTALRAHVDALSARYASLGVELTGLQEELRRLGQELRPAWAELAVRDAARAPG